MNTNLVTKYTVANQDGEIHLHLDCLPLDVAANTPTGHMRVEGHYAATDYYLAEGGVVVEYSEAEKAAKAQRPVVAFHQTRWSNQSMSWSIFPLPVPPALVAAARRQTIIGQIATLEAQQQRPIREVTEAWLAGAEPPEQAAAIVLHIASSIRALRDSLKGLQE